MPLLSDEQAAELRAFAISYAKCPLCGHLTAIDYCRSCDEFYAIHAPGCPTYHHKHSGHRLTIVPFVEDRWRG